MLTKLRIQNFKAWKDTGEIRLAPITVLFGSNSSGKSSISQFLLMLQQTAQSPDRQRVLHLGDAQSPVDLGTFRDIVFDHDERREIDFSLAWILPEHLRVHDPRTGSDSSGESIEFSARIKQEEGTRGQLAVQRMEYKLTVEGDGAITAGMTREAADKYHLAAQGYTLVRNQGRPGKLPAPNKFYGFPAEATAYYQNSEFINDLALRLERQLGRFYYLGPLRQHPQRFYTWSGIRPEHVGWRGEHAIEALLAATERKLSDAPKKRGTPFAKLTAEWLKTMGLIDEFLARPLAAQRKEYEVLVKTRSTNKEWVNLTDVGFGVSQVLPVIVECFYAPPDSTVLLEQPEIHLHPQVQATLADLFIEVIKMREAGRERNTQLIIESHSEHFLRRLQRRIAEEALPPDDTAIYFVESGAKGTSSLRALELDEYGNILNWPKDFFGDEISDLVAMNEATMKRKMRLAG
jgi:predicted ATPase